MRRTILAVDDSPLFLKMIESRLLKNGYQVLTAEDGDAAWREILSRPGTIDLVITDIVMPNLNGVELCRKIKTTPETEMIPVILHTTLESVADRVAGLAAGADDFFIKPVDENELLARTRTLVKLKRHTDDLEKAEVVLRSLALSIEARDPYTGNHCHRISELSASIAGDLGLPDSKIKALKMGGFIHDIGKVAIPDAVLMKPARLDADEISIIRQHPVIGHTICREMKSLKLVTEIIRWHHEKLDGSGYPDGLSGDQIPLTCQIAAVVDVFDALSTRRSYKDAFSIDKTREIMYQETDLGWWNRDVVDCVFDLVDTVQVNGNTVQSKG